MPSADEIQSYLWGVWRLMNGRSDGMRPLDLSADGFWNSFFAMVLALPALGVGWVAFANELGGGEALGFRLSILVRLAIIDLAAWVVPIMLFAVVAGPVGLGNRFVPYVVANNWASPIFIWFLLPPSLMELFWPASGDLAAVLSLGFILVTLVFAWRLTNTVIGMGAAIATAVFVGMFIASVVLLLMLQSLFGLVPG
ncbi:MAG: transporter [Rhizobiaceae bacterium]